MSGQRGMTRLYRWMLVLVMCGVGGGVTPALAQEGSASIVITLYACSDNVDVEAFSAATLQESCTVAEMFPPLDFILSTAEGAETSHQSEEGMLTIDEVPVGGEVTLTESIPEGVGEPIVLCDVVDAAGTVTMESVRVPVVDGNAIVVEPQAGTTLQCSWAHLVGVTVNGEAASPGEEEAVDATPAGSASMTVHLHGCAEDVVAATGAEYLAACTASPVGLISVGDFEDFYEADTTSGEATENSITVERVPETDITVSLLRPQSANSLAVYCSDAATQDDPATWVEPTVSGSFAVTLPVAADDALVCHWFATTGAAEGDAPGNMVEIRAWSCLPDTVAGDDSWSYYFKQCKEADTATTFALSSAAGEQPTTVVRGWSTWTGVGDTFSLQATLAGPSADVVIVCGAYLGNTVAITWPEATAGAFDGTFDVASGQIMTCDWFTMPAASAHAADSQRAA